VKIFPKRRIRENEIEVPAKIDHVSETLKKNVMRVIKRAYAIKDKQVNYVDPDTNISYLATYKEGMLIFSIVDEGPFPNASLLPYLERMLGEPSTKYAKPWIKDTRFTILILFWKNSTI